MAFLTINGVKVKSPDVGLNFEIATSVSGGKNAVGTFVGQKVGRDQYKINNLVWYYLTADEWSKILKLFKNFIVIARFPDMVENTWVTLKMYPGNRTAEPIMLNSDGLPTAYRNCKVNIIDCGVIE